MLEEIAAPSTDVRDWFVILPVVLPLLGAAVLLTLRRAPIYGAGFAILIGCACLGVETALLARILETGPVSMTMGNWPAPFGISFTADPLGAGFALASGGVALLIMVQALGAQRAGEGRDSFFALVMLLLAGINGAYLTGDLFNLYVWFELMLIAAFGLFSLRIGPAELEGTVKYGFLNFVATTVFLAALGFLYALTGTLNMADLIISVPQAPPAPLIAIGALLLLGFGLKAAAFPLQSWLPAAYHTAPPLVSALIAALLTKVGLYALLRVFVAILPETRIALDPVIALIALCTMILGPLGAIAETNLRRALGYLLIGGIGVSLGGLSFDSVRGVAGAAAYGLQAILAMGGFYLVASLVEAVSGATDTRNMGGLYARQKLVSVLFFIFALSVAGVPPFLGFWPKLLIVQGALDASAVLTSTEPEGVDAWGIAIGLGVLLNAFLSLTACARLWAHIFWREGIEGTASELPNPRLRALSRPERLLSLGPTAVLGLLVVGLGLLPEGLIGWGRAAAIELLQPDRYLAATGLASLL